MQIIEFISAKFHLAWQSLYRSSIWTLWTELNRALISITRNTGVSPHVLSQNGCCDKGLLNLILSSLKPAGRVITGNYLVTAAAWHNVLYFTCRFFPVWLWWHRTGHCPKLGSGRAPPEEKSHSPLWSSYGLVLLSGVDRGLRQGPRCSCRASCRGHRPVQRWGAASGPCPAVRGCWRWAWWGWWSLSCWGSLSWMPAPHLRGARERARTWSHELMTVIFYLEVLFVKDWNPSREKNFEWCKDGSVAKCFSLELPKLGRRRKTARWHCLMTSLFTSFFFPHKY